MASTNKTTNYNLSQYVGTDKPTYLGDYNSDMEKIDAQMKRNADNIATAITASENASTTANTAVATANSAVATANSASTSAGEASTTANNAQSTANSALSTATTAQSTANTANTNANTAITGVNELKELFNLSNVVSYGINDFTKDSGTITNSTIKLAYNTDGTIFKLYGTLEGNTTQVCSIQTPLRTDSDFTISPAGINNNGFNLSVNVKTTGVIEFICGWGNANVRNVYFPCVYFNTNFGDEPVIPTE